MENNNNKRTCLYDKHVALGALMSPFGGFEMPIQYAGIAIEHHAVRKKVGLFDVSHMGEVTVKGKDAERYVQHIFTNDIAGAPVGKIYYGMMCYENGGTVDDLLVYKMGENDFFLVINAANIDKDWAWIQQNAKGFDIDLQNRSDYYGQIAVQGPEAEHVVETVLGLPCSELTFYSVKTTLNSPLGPTGRLPKQELSTLLPLRQSYYHLPEPLYLKAGKCFELLYWDHNTRFCGVCGGPMKFHTDISKRCDCGKEVWPQLATAVIVLIHRGPDEVLLARGRSFHRDFFGLIAGFVETGETLEEAVRREVREETGLSIRNIRYFDSQPWPYPCGLMVGFNADYDSGELHVQREELKKAGWFHRDHLPNLPEKLSIARRLIDNWLGEDA